MAKFIPITKAPPHSDKNAINYKYGGNNHAYPVNKTDGYVFPNCCGMPHYAWLHWGLVEDEAKLSRNDAHTYYDKWTGAKGKTPKLGAFVCFKGGSGTYAGYGHVAVVQEIDTNQNVKVIASDASGSSYYTKWLYKSNGYNWSSKLQFVGFGYPSVDLAKEDAVDYTKHNVKCKKNINVRSEPSLKGAIVGSAVTGDVYEVFEQVSADGYTWDKIGSNRWIATTNDWVTDIPKALYEFDTTGKDFMWSVDGALYNTSNSIRLMDQFGDQSLVKKGYKEVFKVNGGLFWKDNSDNGYYKAIGLERSFGVTNQDWDSEFDSAMSFGIKKDNGHLVFAPQSYNRSHLNEYYGALTGIGVLYLGKATNMGHASNQFGGQWNALSGKTIIGENKEGTKFFIFTLEGATGVSGLYGKDMVDICLKAGMYNAIMLDSGGSVFAYVNGKMITKTDGRKVKNAVMLYVKDDDIPQQPDDGKDERIDELEAEVELLKERVNSLIDVNDQLNANLEQTKTALEETKTQLTDKTTRIDNAVEDLTGE